MLYIKTSLASGYLVPITQLLLFESNSSNANSLGTWNDYLGSHYRDRSWERAIRDPAGPSSGGFVASDAKIPILDMNGNLTTKDLDDFLTLYLPDIRNALNNDNIIVLPFGGLGSAKASENGFERVSEFMDLILEDAAIFRRAMYERAKAVAQIGSPENVYWQIGNEISATSYSTNLHMWAEDGIRPKDSDISIIEMFVEYFLAPGVEGIEQASVEVFGQEGKINLMLGSIVNINKESKQIFLEAILDYEIKGLFSPSLKGKKVAQVINSVSIHYSMAGTSFAWETYLDSLIAERMKTNDRLQNLFTTEEIGFSAAKSGRAPATAAKIFSRYYSWWEKHGWNPNRGHLFFFAPDENGEDETGETVPNTSASVYLESLNELIGGEYLTSDKASVSPTLLEGAAEWYHFKGAEYVQYATFFPENENIVTVQHYDFSYLANKEPEVTLLLMKSFDFQTISVDIQNLGNNQYRVDLSNHNLEGKEGLSLVIK